jgi:SulP family sulfate permease
MHQSRRRARWYHRFQPSLSHELRKYRPEDLMPDLIAGITVGLVALPLAMAFGIASGVTPQAGIYTAVLGGFLVSALGGSKIQIGGPTGAFVVIIAGIVAKHGISGLLMVTMMAGCILLFLSVSGLGKAVRFIPRPVIIGFTNGIAVLIVSTQIRDFFGLQIARVPSEFIERLQSYGESASTVQLPALALGTASLAIILLTPRVVSRVPGTIVALFGATLATYLFQLPVETIGTKFGGIPSGLPTFRLPEFRPELVGPLLPSALTVAFLAAVESLLSAVVSDRMTGDRHNPSAELMAHGTANLLVPLVGGIPVTGAIARTATNYKSGARTPVAGIVHSITLAAVILIFAPLAQYIPLATLAAVLFVVAYNMGEWSEIPGILRLELADKLVWLITFTLTVLADLTVAVEVGIALAALLYIYRVSETTTVGVVTPEYIDQGRRHSLQDKVVPPYVSIVRIHGPFLFGTAEMLMDVFADVSRFQPIVILRLRNMTAIDATGLHALEWVAAHLRRSGRTLLLCGARRQPAKFLRRAEFREHIGEKNILPNVDEALRRAAEIAPSNPAVQHAIA